jgi:hypothetical protein
MKARAVSCAVLLALVLAACGPLATTPSATRSESSMHLVVALSGNLSVKRLGWSDYTLAPFGTTLRSGDLLRLDSGAQATVACADLTVAKAAGGVSSVPCNVSKPILVYGDSLIVPTRDDAPLDIPRKTKVMAARPILRWSPVTGATTYSVTVRGPNLNWTTAVSGQTELAYPANAPALAAGQSYKLSVQAGSRISDDERTPGLGFTMLKAEEAQAVRDGETRIRSLALADNATRLLIANLYASQGMTCEAIDLLESLAATAQEPPVVRALGDLYVKVGLNRMAEEQYIQAIELSQKTGNIEGQAAADSALGLVYESLGNKAEAIQLTQKAVEWYQKLGDTKTIKQLQDRLAALQKP